MQILWQWFPVIEVTTRYGVGVGGYTVGVCDDITMSTAASLYTHNNTIYGIIYTT